MSHEVNYAFKRDNRFSDFLASLYSNCYDFGFFDNDNRISLYMLGPIEEIDTLQVY